MGVLVMASIAALGLIFVTVSMVFIIKLVLFVSLRYTIVGSVILAIYWMISAHRRQIAKGFYSCTDIPAVDSVLSERKIEQRNQQQTKIESKPDCDLVRFDNKVMTMSEMNHQLTLEKKRIDGSVTDSEGERISFSDSCRTDDSDKESIDSEGFVCRDKLPQLRRHTSVNSIIDSPRRTLSAYSSQMGSKRPDPLAREEQLAKTALESEGYWIGDFRVTPNRPTISRRLTTQHLSSQAV